MDRIKFPGRNQEWPITGSATPEMTDVGFWDVDDNIIMNQTQITEYNEYLENQEGLGLVNILDAPIVLQGRDVVAMIEKTGELDLDSFLGDERITGEDVENLNKSRGLSAVPMVVNVQCGLISYPADLRSFPTTLPNTNDGIIEGEQSVDDFQSTRLYLGEPILIYHQSEDKLWYFVQAHNYRGWVKKTCIVLCSRNIWEEHYTTPRFVVTTERKTLEVCGIKMTIEMGTRIPIENNGQMRIPTRTLDGNLKFISTNLDIETCRGTLPFTSRNLLDQAFKLLGDPLSWGAKSGYTDSSGTITAIFSCFGIFLPRDSSKMAKININALDRGNGVDYTNLRLGTLLICRGHAMIFLGVRNGIPYVIHNFGSYIDDSNEVIDIFRTEIMSLTDVRRVQTGNTYEEDIFRIVEIKAI